MLRQWQVECSNRALRKYKSNQSHFFCQATPGAGKTVLAATITSRLLDDNMIDLVLCFSPSISVADGIKSTFSKVLNCTFSGGLGSIGQSLTYQSIQFLGDDFWQTLRSYRVFVVFDEVHHCSGSRVENANVWGQQVLTKVQNLAHYTLALSGTPWRSDSLPIVMSEYTDPDGRLRVDYQYTLQQAITDRVCRAPKIVLVDNEHLLVTNEEKVESYSSIVEMLKQTQSSYRNVIHNPEAMEYLLGIGCSKLAEIRSESPKAGGLVVASSVQHAQSIRKVLVQKYSQSVSIVTYRHEEPLAEVERYREGTTQWIVSVGMISEGTDIPRLQVCCHMSSVKTELYFRQVLGRILRTNGPKNQQAWLYTFAEQNLIEFSEQIEHDIPQSCMFASMTTPIKYDAHGTDKVSSTKLLHQEPDDNYSQLGWATKPKYQSAPQTLGSEFDEIRLGSFKQRVIAAFSSQY